MLRAIRVLIAVVLITALAVVARAAPRPAANCSSGCAYLPVVMKPQEATPTPTVTTAPTAAPTATPLLPPPTFNNCQADPNPNAALNYPVKITAINKVAETVTLQNVSTIDQIYLGEWHMCSVTGNQEHPIGGMLAPGETRTFPNTGGPIWSNSSRDDGALYDVAGRLVSYWFDT